jgi:N-acetylglucosaminyldiphosphoundecaprenol N-acetyl-beta-D-mannosaminyltransferase
MTTGAAQRASITILGVRIDDVTEAEALALIAEMIDAGGPHQVVTVNPEFVVEARRNSAFRRVLAASALATPDGFGLALVAGLRGRPLRERVTGIALTRMIAAEAARRGWRIFFLGAAPGVAAGAAALLQRDHPRLVVAGCYSGSPRAEDEAHLRAIITAAHPDVLLVAYGHPRQDMWIARNQPLLRIPVAIGVGGTFDEIAGVVRPAPAWLHRLGLKWLYRLITQPQRWRRIMDAVPVFLWHALREKSR